MSLSVCCPSVSCRVPQVALEIVSAEGKNGFALGLNFGVGFV